MDFEKELNELMDLQEQIDELSKQITEDLIVFGKTDIIFPPIVLSMILETLDKKEKV
jgi:hypothetical protein